MNTRTPAPWILVASLLAACDIEALLEEGEQDTAAGGETDEEVAMHDCHEDRYTPLQIQGWEVCIETVVLDTPSTGDAVRAQLDADLDRVLSVLDPAVSAELQGVRIWVEQDSSLGPGAVYHPSAEWLEQNGYPTYWAASVQILSVDSYLSWISYQPAIVLHELAHAWHHQHVGYDDASVIAAYDAAMASGIYSEVEHADGSFGTAYATSNVQEYFAELTEAWFWENDFYPFVRADLQAFDSQGAAAVEGAWLP